MSFIKPLFITTSIFLSSISFAGDNHKEGEKLFNATCAACHGVAVGGMDMNKRIAPPIIGVRKHYLDAYPDETSFVAAISSWLEKQDESKSLMPGAIRHFKIMPPINVPKADAAKIAAYIYDGDIQKPDGFDKHEEEMHGQEGHNKKNHEEMQHDHNNHENMGKMKHRMKLQRGKHKGGMRFMRKIMKQLNLSPQQAQQMKALMQQKKSIMQPLQKELHQIRQNINHLDTTGPDYKNQIFALADKKSKLVFRMVIEKGEMRMKMESVLSPEQRNKFQSLKHKRFENKKKN